jgi:hypothetical protein
MTRSILRWNLALLLIVLLSSCGAGASAKPTVDPQLVYTQVAETVQAGIALTQAAMPTSTTTPTMTITTTPTITATSTLSTQQPTLTAYIPGSSESSTGDNITWVADITIPDGTVVTPSDHLHKVWEVKNSGTTTWTTDYKLIWIDITNFDYNNIANVVPTTEIKISKEVKPGETINIAVDLIAPSKNGTYKIFFRMLNPSGQFFGDPGWVLITVGNPTAAPTATATP